MPYSAAAASFQVSIPERNVVDMLRVLNTVLPVLLTLALGAFARKKQIIPPQGAASLKLIVSNFTLPAVVFGAFYNAHYDVSIFVFALVMLLCCSLGLLLGKLAVKLLRIGQPLLPFLTSGFEVGMMGYALYTMLFGAEHLTSMAIADLGQVVFVFSVYMSLLNAQSGMGKKETIRAMLYSPPFWGIFSGLVIGVTGLGALIANSAAGSVLESVLSFLGAPTGYAILFAIGYEIRISRSNLKDALIAAISRLVIMAGLSLLALTLVNLFIPVDVYLKYALLLVFLLPAPFMLPIFVKDPVQSSYASTCLSLYTLISIGLFAVLTVFAQGAV